VRASAPDGARTYVEMTAVTASEVGAASEAAMSPAARVPAPASAAMPTAAMPTATSAPRERTRRCERDEERGEQRQKLGHESHAKHGLDLTSNLALLGQTARWEWGATRGARHELGLTEAVRKDPFPPSPCLRYSESLQWR
jgi:hypothetical protein